MDCDESTLIEQAQRGLADAISTLYRRYYPLAWQWAYALAGDRSRADDVAQDAILRAFGALGKFDPQRPLGPWLKRVVLNVARDELRRLRRGALSVGWMDDRRAAPSPDESRASDPVVAAVRTLTPARRTVIVLHYWLDLPIDEVAAYLDLPYGTVASRLARALADLRAVMEEERV